MNKKNRRIFFCTLVCVFFTAGYLALLFAFGYTYDFEMDKFVKTGSIYLDANVSSLVSVGNSKPKKTSLIGNDFTKKYLLPGVYTIKVAKEGYATWSKTIEIPAGFVASFNNIALLPEDLSPTVVFPNIKNLYPDDSGKSAFYIDANNQFGFVDFSRSEVKPFSSTISIAPAIFSWDELNGQVFLSNFATSKIIGKDERTMPVPSAVLNPTLEIEGKYLVSQLGQTISVYNHETGSFEDRINNASSFYANGNNIYYINSKDNLLYVYDLNKKEILLVSGADNFKGGTLLKAEKVQNDVYVLIRAKTQNHIFKINPEKVALIAQNADDFKFSYDKKMLAWRSFDGIYVYWLEDTKNQPFKKAGDTEKITNLRDIKDFYWHKQNGHLILFTDRLIRFVEIDTRSGPISVTVFDSFRDYKSETGPVPSLENGSYNGDLNAVYFTMGKNLLKILLEK